MGLYIIIYGSLQSYSSQLCLRPFNCQPPKSKHVAPWTFLLAILLLIFGFLYLSIHGVSSSTSTSTSSTLPTNIQNNNNLWWTLSIFTPIISIIAAVVMAVLSSIHSYLIVLFSGRNKVAKVNKNKIILKEIILKLIISFLKTYL